MLSTVKKIVLGVINAVVRIVILLIVFSMIKKVCLTAYDYGYRVFSERPMTEGEGFDESVVVPVGSSAMDIGKILKNKGLIRDEKLFYIQVLLSSYRGKLNPGDYVLNSSMTAEDMMRVMAGADEEEDEEDQEKSGTAASEGNSTVTVDVTSESGAIDEDAGSTEEDSESDTGSGEEENDTKSDEE
ncbi:MAG: endolytic transglycosylase MltG [Lachnospiraceae bacterium]|nr:endolytic transglycosylase MltG [Lachnospiraceae bacterium]